MSFRKSIAWREKSDLVLRVKKKKTTASSWFHSKFNFSETNDFKYFYDSHGYIKKKLYSSHKLSVDLIYEIFFVCWKKCCSSQSWQNEDKFNFCSFFRYSLNKRVGAGTFNSMKLVYLTLLCSDCRAWALKLSKDLKKEPNVSSKLGLKGH